MSERITVPMYEATSGSGRYMLRSEELPDYGTIFVFFADTKPTERHSDGWVSLAPTGSDPNDENGLVRLGGLWMQNDKAGKRLQGTVQPNPKKPAPIPAALLNRKVFVVPKTDAQPGVFELTLDTPAPRKGIELFRKAPVAEANPDAIHQSLFDGPEGVGVGAADCDMIPF